MLGSALVSCAMTVAGLGPAGVAHAVCASVNGTPVGPGCSKPSYQLADQAQKQVVSVGPRPSTTGAVAASTAISDASTDADADPGDPDTAGAPSNPVAVAETMLGTDVFGPYGCEDFVDAAYGRTTSTGIAHDAALYFYQSLADRGLAHHEMPIPRGALVFSNGPDGGHVDISRGDNTYVSGGVQGLSPGYGDGHNVQILPAPNLGSWTLSGWAYPPW
ncbi:hypothetical protein ABIA30_004514 [Mycobacterium sp. MAA66]|uniref:hypothetical protein n=1 Tax=Mycobacterium sp. MAA66 TaxID=3156297 RepID=UPI0035186DE2